MKRVVDLTALNPEQLEAVEHIAGPTLVLAGAGSGKTRVLTYKIAYLVAHGINPWHILAVTFTNKAAREMIERVERLLDMTAANLWLGTFHSMCVRILRQEANRWGFPRSFTIYDRDDQTAVIRKALKELGRKAEGPFAPGKALAVIGRAKNDGIPPEGLQSRVFGPDAPVFVELYARYNRRLHDAGAFDFDDLLLKPVEMFGIDGEALRRWQNRFSYVLVDEYQDTNRVQYRLVQLLCGGSGNVTVVGDDDQSIYSWRGADIRNILDFESEFSGVRTVRLEQNYRSTGHILAAANAVVTNNISRMKKHLWTNMHNGARLRILECIDDHDEAERIITEIQREQEQKKCRLRDFAILYRTNAQSRLFEEVFIRRGIPYVIVGGIRFYERREIKDILSYLRLVVNPDDAVSFERAVTVPPRGIGDKTIEAIERFAEKNSITIVDALARAESFLPGRMAAKLEAFHHCLRSAGEMRGTARLDEIALAIVELVGYTGYLENEFADSAEDRMDNVNELITAMGEFVNETDEDDLASFLAEVSLVADVDAWDDRSDAVTLMTLHSAKGLEFQTVCIAGVEKGLFPLPVSFESDAGLEEERRLFYVGITRAREQLHISYACQRFRYGSFSGGASMFIAEIPPEVVEFEAPEHLHAVSIGKTAGKTAKQKSRIVTFGDYSQEAPDHTESGLFIVGAFVRHPTFGLGRITEVSGSGDNLMLTILFGTQKRKILPKYANLIPA